MSTTYATIPVIQDRMQLEVDGSGLGVRISIVTLSQSDEHLTQYATIGTESDLKSFLTGLFLAAIHNGWSPSIFD